MKVNVTVNKRKQSKQEYKIQPVYQGTKRVKRQLFSEILKNQ